jgi:hypothetical protein
MGVPDGWVLMSAYDTRPDKKAGGPSGDYRRLLDASKTNKIRVQTIPGVRGMLVLKEEADEYLKKCEQLAAKSADTPDAAEATLAIEVLEKIAKSLERIAAAMETQYRK